MTSTSQACDDKRVPLCLLVYLPIALLLHAGWLFCFNMVSLGIFFIFMDSFSINLFRKAEFGNYNVEEKRKGKQYIRMFENGHILF